LYLRRPCTNSLRHMFSPPFFLPPSPLLPSSSPAPPPSPPSHPLASTPSPLPSYSFSLPHHYPHYPSFLLPSSPPPPSVTRMFSSDLLEGLLLQPVDLVAGRTSSVSVSTCSGVQPLVILLSLSVVLRHLAFASPWRRAVPNSGLVSDFRRRAPI